jgi:hypothetical protein
MNIQEQIKRILREESNRKETFRDYAKSNGLKFVFMMVGGPENYIRAVYNGDIKEYFRNEEVEPYYIKRVGQEINMYIDDVIVKHLNLEDKVLGKFFYGSGYTVEAVLISVKGDKWRVAAVGGSRGFGYHYINKRDELGSKFRQQIFQQIINKYNLNDY